VVDNKKHQKPAHKLRRFFVNKKWPIIITSIFMLLAVVLASTWFVIDNNTNKNPSSTIDVETENREKIVNEKLENTADSARLLVANGDLAGAAKVYDAAILSSKDDVVEGDLLLSKAVMYFNSGDYDQSLAAAKEAEAIRPSANLAQFMATIYESKLDNISAISYYKKAIKLIEPSDPLAESSKSSYQSSITRLAV